MKKLVIFLLFAAPFVLDAQMTYVPDDNFEQALIDLGLDTLPLNDYVPTKNIDTVINLNVSSKNIIDLTGIEAFKSLNWLYCSYNRITNLDVTHNDALISLSCTSIGLNNLKVGNNPNLIALHCNSNVLTKLDLSSCISLKELFISYNLLKELDVSKNPNLEVMDCSSNRLTSLNAKNGNNTKLAAFDSRFNYELFCIQVDDYAFAVNNSTWREDPQAEYSEDCNYDYVKVNTYIPDDNFEKALVDLGYDNLPLNDSVATKNILMVTSLHIAKKDISDLTGIEDFKSLDSLDCSYDSITNLDVSHNHALSVIKCYKNSIANLNVSYNHNLKVLSCQDNNLTNLDIRNTPYLYILDCSFNRLTGLDASNNPSLKWLWCQNNQLSSLNVQNGDNSNLQIVNAENNPNLNCIQVDDSIFAANNSAWIKDPIAHYSNDCGYTAINDFNFENKSVSVAPNPASDFIEINLTDRRVNPSVNDDVKIYNFLGEIVSVSNTPPDPLFLEGGKCRIDVSGLVPGVYFVRVGDYVQRFVKY